jgi:hypothetical protein
VLDPRSSGSHASSASSESGTRAHFWAGRCVRPERLGGTLENLLVVKPDQTSSGLQATKAKKDTLGLDSFTVFGKRHAERLASIY